MLGQRIIDKIIEEGLVSAHCEGVIVWEERSAITLNDFIMARASERGGGVLTCSKCGSFYNCNNFCDKRGFETFPQSIACESFHS